MTFDINVFSFESPLKIQYIYLIEKKWFNNLFGSIFFMPVKLYIAEKTIYCQA
jgi:hypothetical protein